MGLKLTSTQLEQTALAIGFEPRAIRAVIKVETNGSGYDKITGFLLIQFEPSWFRRLLPKPIMQGITAASTAVARQTASLEQTTLVQDWVTIQTNLAEGQVRERAAFDAAVRIDAHTAHLATSWGLGQMMGFNYQACGYTTAEAMIEAFRQSEANQLTGMLRFIKGRAPMARALKKKDWGVFAYYYNGAGYKANHSDRKLAKAYESLA